MRLRRWLTCSLVVLWTSLSAIPAAALGSAERASTRQAPTQTAAPAAPAAQASAAPTAAATTPATAPPAAAPTAATAPTAAPATAPAPTAITTPAAAPGAASLGGAVSATPELSFPIRFPIPTSLIVASLDEPALPARLAAALGGSAAAEAPGTAQGAARPAEPARIAEAPAAKAPPSSPERPATLPSPPSERPAAAAPSPAKPEPRAAAVKPASAAERKKPPARPSSPVADAVVRPVLPLAPPSTQEYVLPAAESPPAVSRNVSAFVGERIEIPFDGSGWTYLGEKDEKDGVTYETRRFEGPGVVFVMDAAKSGQYVLRFQRQDLLRGLTSLELVGVDVRDKPAVVVPPATAPGSAIAASAGQAPAGSASGGPSPAPYTLAPTAPGPAGAAATGSGQSAAAGGAAAISAPGLASAPGAASLGASAPGTSAPGTASLGASAPGTATPGTTATVVALPPPDSPEGMLLAAKNELGAGRTQSALAILDRFLAKYPAGTDEAYYLYGLALEQNGPLKDIRRAYSYYKKVVDAYPESPYWDKADERVSYIQRYYFDIR